MTRSTTFDEFEAVEVQAEDVRIFVRHFGSGPPILLLHGFPQTHLMWRSVAARVKIFEAAVSGIH